MTNTVTEFLVTSCPDHGTVEAPDLRTRLAVLPAVRVCSAMAGMAPMPHARQHWLDGTDCWQCCPSMTIHE